MTKKTEILRDHFERIEWFKRVILPHEEALRHFLLRSSQWRGEADDLLAESLARAYASERWAGIAQGRAYLFKIARNLIVDEMRRRKIVAFDSMHNFDDLSVQDETPSIERVISARAELRLLNSALEKLPERCRQVFLLRRVHECSMKEIAERLGLSVSTVEKHLGKALVLLTHILSELEASPSDTGSVDKAWLTTRKN